MVGSIEVRSRFVVGGKISNRVKERRVRKPPHPPKHHRQDKDVRGLGHRTICVSLPQGELADLDALADRVQMARSHVIRQEVKRFAVFVLTPPKMTL